MAATAFAPIEAGNEIVLVDVEYLSLTINKEIINLALKKDPDIKVNCFRQWKRTKRRNRKNN